MRVDEGLLARAADALQGAEADPAARRVLTAARAAFASRGIQATTMDDVAQAAEVGRATVYRKFDNRDALVEAVLLDDLLRYLDRLELVMDDAGDELVDQLVEGYVHTLRWVREESLLTAVMEHDGDWGMRYFTAALAPVLAAARTYLAARLRRARPDRTGPDVDHVAELLVRLCHSLMLTPDGVIPHDDDAASRAFARSVVAPLVG